MKTKWIFTYKCGCEFRSERKRDLLNYCPKHGSSVMERIDCRNDKEKKVPAKRKLR